MTCSDCIATDFVRIVTDLRIADLMIVADLRVITDLMIVDSIDSNSDINSKMRNSMLDCFQRGYWNHITEIDRCLIIAVGAIDTYPPMQIDFSYFVNPEIAYRIMMAISLIGVDSDCITDFIVDIVVDSASPWFNPIHLCLWNK